MDRATTSEPAGQAPHRSLPIEAHRLLSDGRSTALITPTAEIDWWCWPRMSSAPLAWSLLDRDGGSASFVGASHVAMNDAPAGPTSRTTLRVDGHTIEVWDGMLACGDTSDLVRLVRATTHPIDVTHALRLGCFDNCEADWVDGRLQLPEGSLWFDGGHTVVDDRGVALTRVRAEPGVWTAIVLRGHEHPHDVEDIVAGLRRVEAAHARALDECRLPKRHAERARHALAVIEACTDRVTGAVIASPTTSLPEVVGGDRQFDYRYAWLRDGAAAIAVASLLGRDTASLPYVEFLERLGPDGVLSAPMHGVDGDTVPDERDIPDVEGWSGSRPVRVGNAAKSQLQWDAIGIVLDALLVHTRRRRTLGRAGWSLVVALADRACEGVDEPSHGIWEQREAAMLVSADVGRWLALDRALRIARMTRPFLLRGRWKRARNAARVRVLGALRPDGTLPHAYGAETVDASGLLVVTYGLLASTDPRAAALVDGTIAALGSGPLLYRYPPDGRDGFSPGEAPFVPASWWAVTALAKIGRPEAQARADELCGALPALLPEEFDPVRRESLGNTPLVWSHAECARALFELDRQRRLRRRVFRGMSRAARRPFSRGPGFAASRGGHHKTTGDHEVIDPELAKEVVMSDVVDKIEHDHREVEQMFADFKQSHSRDKALEICDELEKHTKAEDAAVYPVFEDELSNEKDKIHEAEDEHKEARQLIGRVRNTTDEAHLVDLMAELEKEIQHHVKEEETEMLPKARNELPASELDELGEKFDAAKKSAG